MVWNQSAMGKREQGMLCLLGRGAFSCMCMYMHTELCVFLYGSVCFDIYVYTLCCCILAKSQLQHVGKAFDVSHPHILPNGSTGHLLVRLNIEQTKWLQCRHAVHHFSSQQKMFKEGKVKCRNIYATGRSLLWYMYYNTHQCISSHKVWWIL